MLIEVFDFLISYRLHWNKIDLMVKCGVIFISSSWSTDRFFNIFLQLAETGLERVIFSMVGIRFKLDNCLVFYI